MSSSSSTQFNEDELKALSRKDLQALAKKENIKPANASSATLIQRLLVKFGLAAKQESSHTKTKVKIPTPNDAPFQKRRSTRLATTETQESVSNKFPASAPSYPAPDGAPAAENSPLHHSPTTIHPAVIPNSSIPASPSVAASTSASPQASTSQLLIAPLRAKPAHPPASSQPSGSALIDEPPTQEPAAPDPLYTGQAVHPSYPNQPFPCPTHKTLDTYQDKLMDLNHVLLDIPCSLSTMERVLPGLEHTAHTVMKAVKTIVWNGYYFEREVVEKMKYRQQLWDGTSVMSPGPARDRWFAFLGEVTKEYDRLDQEALDQEAMDQAARDLGMQSDSSSAASLSSKSLKRQREEEDEAESSKRPRSERSLLFSA
ncbi:hypothetical protein B0H19DRAFT_22597 [Mycena capillaripes]|nr:hypothetical protein B0H19DRAFT_22597 [Mycena capillaripes]